MTRRQGYLIEASVARKSAKIGNRKPQI